MGSPSVSILMSDKTTVAGNGILIADNRVLTTAETVALALMISPSTQSKPENEVLVELIFNSTRTLVKSRIVHWLAASPKTSSPSNTIDNIAVLQLPEINLKPEPNLAVARNVLTSRDYQLMIDAITEGSLVPFFGAGVNLCGRPQNARWRRGEFLPSAQELAIELAKRFNYPWSDTQDLVRVSQYVALIRGLGPLNRRLRFIFDRFCLKSQTE